MVLAQEEQQQQEPNNPAEEQATGEVGIPIPPPGNPVALNDETFEQIGNAMEIMIVNFYADWCRFSQMLKPVYAAAANQLADVQNVRFGSINCEAPDTVGTRTKNHISKYPTIKIFRHGIPLKSEYRGQRSPDAIARYVRELIAEPVLTVNDEDEIMGHVNKFKRVIVGHFSGEHNDVVGRFEELAGKMRDDCHFLMQKNSPKAGEGGAAVEFRSKVEQLGYDGDIGNFDAVEEWSREHCSPLVREITFENGEELTEEGLPFLIMFHAPDDHESVRQFTQVVKERLSNERGNINFITADGHKFAHPLRHLGKTKADLPVLAIDTFKHMYLFKRFENIHKNDKLEKFILDLHSGKLHHNFHHPPTEGDDDEPPEPEVAEPDQPTTKKATLKEKVEKAEKQVINSDEMKVKQEVHKDSGHDHEDDPSILDGKPVAVKSVLKNLKPSETRYSFAMNRDEL